jgi:GTP-sensing pleiotropic transcriptional regulator CodY
MFIPSIPVPWFKMAMEATKGRGGATIAVVWLESRLQSRDTFVIRKSITDKLGFTKRGRQTMVEHLRLMQQTGLIELSTVGKKYPRVRILSTEK